MPQTYNLLAKPTHLGVQASSADITTYTAAKTVWNKKNAQVLGLMQASVTSHMARLCSIWHDKGSVGCPGDPIWKSRGSHNLPPIGQHGENSIH